MNFHLDFRFGFALFLVLILSGVGSYFYSTQVTFSNPILVPYTYYVPQQQRHATPTPPTENDYLHVQNTINPQSTFYFGYYDATQYQFNEIYFSFSETATTTSLFIRGLSNGIVWGNWSTNHGIEYIPVYSNDSYRVEIYNPSSSSAVYVSGSISFSHVEIVTIQVPQTGYTTEYQTGTYTNYPYRSLSGVLLVLGALAGFGTGVSVLISRRRMKEIL